nr:MAG TPA: hypothetical protein [Caudoviricetes sp.]
MENFKTLFLFFLLLLVKRFDKRYCGVPAHWA